MSRIGKQPILIPAMAKIECTNRHVTVSGPKGSIDYQIPSGISVLWEEPYLKVLCQTTESFGRALHGTTRANLANAVHGVCEGYQKTLVLEGLGYRAALEGRQLILEVGFSHSIEYEIPEGIEITVDGKNEITVSGIKKDLVGRVAATIRAYRPPEPYKGRGIRYQDEVVRRKLGKAAKGAEGI